MLVAARDSIKVKPKMPTRILPAYILLVTDLCKSRVWYGMQ